MGFSAIKKSHKKQGYLGYSPEIRPAPSMVPGKYVPVSNPLKPSVQAPDAFKSIKHRLRKK